MSRHGEKLEMLSSLVMELEMFVCLVILSFHVTRKKYEGIISKETTSTQINHTIVAFYREYFRYRYLYFTTGKSYWNLIWLERLN
jgi:hypothetical protein